MATVTKDFKVKNGLIVEGTSGTINNYDILTKKPDDQNYIIGLIGGSATSNATPDTVVLRDANADFSANMITSDLTGDVTGTVSDISNHDTGDLVEGTNLYYTAARAKAEAADLLTNATKTNIVITKDGSNNLTITAENGVADSTTDDLTEGSVNLYYTNARVDAYINASIDTDDVSEGSSNLYYTDTRARNAVDSGDGLNYNSATGVFTAHLGNGLEIGVGGAIQIDDLVVATETDLTNAINNHDVASGVHGVTGNVVGTTDTQTISNKTLGSDLDADGFTITNLGTPVNGGDAATKAYVDGSAAGLTWKAAVNLLSNTNISLTGNANTTSIDGHSLAAADGYRVLLLAQSTDSENGLYDVDVTSGTYTFTRSADADTYTELVGAAVFVMEGTTYGSTSWVQSNTYLSNFTSQSWVQFSGSGTYVAGNGLTLNGNEFSIDETITATHTYVSTEIGTHASDTSTHGVTGAIVGTTDSQTLTNKTLGASTVLGANLDASSYKITNLEDPTANQDAATKFYVDTEVSGVSGDLTTHAGLTTGTHGVTGTIVGTSDTQTLTNKTIDGSSNTISNIANSSLVNDSITVNGFATALGSSVTLDTDDVAEGTTNKYFTDNRAKDAAGYILENATQTNVVISYDDLTHQLTVTAENGVADSTTDDLTEGTTNLYFTNARAVSALEGVTPNFPAVEINSVAKQVAAQASVPTASTNTAVSWLSADYRSAEFLVKIAAGSHTEVSKVILTLDTTDNVAITEYAIVGTNGSLGSVSADVSGTDVRLRVTTANNSSTVTVVGTLLA